MKKVVVSGCGIDIEYLSDLIKSLNGNIECVDVYDKEKIEELLSEFSESMKQSQLEGFQEYLSKKKDRPNWKKKKFFE